MNLAYVTLLIFLVVYALIYYSSIKPALSCAQKPKNTAALFWLLAAFCLVLRLITASFIEGFSTDITCFKSWSQMVYTDGFSNFYSSSSLTDYPPGYMYVLYVIGFLRNLFSLDYNSASFTVLIKLPAIICDILAGFLIYKISSKNDRARAFSLSLAAIYLLNPAVIINSSAWGQVDSVYTVFVFLFIYLLYENKYILSCITFAAGFLFKPQIIIFAPVIGCFFLYRLIVKKEVKDILLKTAKAAVICILMIFAFSLPFTQNFNFSPVFSQYISTIKSYPYASVNAYNFFALTGGNWQDVNSRFIFLTYNIWSWIFIAAACVTTLVIFFRSKDKNIYFKLGAFIITAVFTFAAKMHERYCYPAMILLIGIFITTLDKRFLKAYIAMSVSQFICAACVLYMDIANNSTAMPDGALPYILCTANIGIFVYLFKIIIKNPNADTQKTKKFTFALESSAKNKKLKKADFIIMAAVTLVYSVFAFLNLGDIHAAQTHCFIPMGTTVTFDFDESVSNVKWYNGYLEERKIDIYSNDEDLTSLDTKSVFAWHETDIAPTNHVEIYFYSDSDITEISFSNAQTTIAPKNVYCADSSVNISNLTDEADLVAKTISYKNSTYFDEVYHARTAYEYIHLLDPYENTHPPLGKLLISLGILIFGMTPFGWRFAGTLCGIIMLPVMYVFAKKMFSSTKAALFAILLTALDFMHFTQTRIATIDVFVTLFIIISYYFMYLYVCQSFYDTPLKKTLLPLGLSGLFFGFAAASKWTGIYAGAGLCVIFFISISKRIYEYVKITSLKSASAEDKKKVCVLKKNTALTLLFCIAAFVIVPVMIYCASYIPYLKAPGMQGIKSIIENQKSMFDYHSTLKATHPYSSFWYQWPFISRPVWYYTNSLGGGMRQSIAALGNPLIWWAGFAAIIFACFKCFKKDEISLSQSGSAAALTKKNALFITIAFLAEYIPWIGVTRCVFLYHYFPSVPFIILAICLFYKTVSEIADVKTLKKYDCAALVYIVLCFILFAVFYPLLSGTAASENYLDTLKWFPTWYF